MVTLAPRPSGRSTKIPHQIKITTEMLGPGPIARPPRAAPRGAAGTGRVASAGGLAGAVRRRVVAGGEAWVIRVGFISIDDLGK